MDMEERDLVFDGQFEGTEFASLQTWPHFFMNMHTNFRRPALSWMDEQRNAGRREDNFCDRRF